MSRGLLMAVGVLAAGCGSQVGSSYEGEALVTLHGTALYDSTAPLPPLDVVVAWISAPPTSSTQNPDTTSYESVPVPITGAFPARFDAEVVAKPPADALSVFFEPEPGYGDEPVFATGLIAAVAHGTQYSIESRYGLEYLDTTPYNYELHELLYLPADFPAGSLTAQRYGALTAGYHLVFAQQLSSLPDTDAARYAVSYCSAALEAEGDSESMATTICTSVHSVQFVDQPFDTSLTLHIEPPS